MSLISVSQHRVVVGTSELISCWPPLLLHRVRHVGVSCPILISFFYLEILTGEFRNYSDLFVMLGPVSVLLEELLHSSWHRSGIQPGACVTPHAQRAAVQQHLQRLEAMEERRV